MATTTVRIAIDARERLRRLEHKLGRNTAETLNLAIEALEMDLAWDDVETWYESNPQPDPEDELWVANLGGTSGRASR